MIYVVIVFFAIAFYNILQYIEKVNISVHNENKKNKENKENNTSFYFDMKMNKQLSQIYSLITILLLGYI